MLTVARMLELSLASSISPETAAERAHQINTFPHPLRRLGAKALHDFAINHPGKAVQLMQRSIAPHGLEYLGCGVESSVYRKQDEVLKVNRSSIEMGLYDRKKLLSEKRAGFLKMADYLGRFLLDQTIIIDAHPLGSDITAVITKQPYYPFAAHRPIFRINEPNVDLPALEALCIRFPGVDSALTDFVDASYFLVDESDCLPDINGPDNLVVGSNGNVDTSELILIDSQPITTQHPVVQQLVMDQLASLKLGLLEVA